MPTSRKTGWHLSNLFRIRTVHVSVLAFPDALPKNDSLIKKQPADEQL